MPRPPDAIHPAGPALLRRALTAALDLLLPPRCLLCGSFDIHRQGLACTECWSGLAFASGPACPRCALPLPAATAAGLECGDCLQRPPPFERTAAALLYEGGVRPLIARFKHGDGTWAAPWLAQWMLPSCRPLLQDGSVLVPVPIHRWRMLRRRYNQAALLAWHLGRASGLSCLPDALLRRRATQAQGRLGRRQRAKNIAHAIVIHPARRSEIAGRHIVLVDDVMTTGATLRACAQALSRAGAASVRVAVLARTP